MADVVYAGDSAQVRNPALPHTLRTAAMRLTLALLGLELDVTFGPATAEDEADDGAALNGGTLAAYPISFTSWPVPEEAPIQQHTPAWDEPDE